MKPTFLRLLLLFFPSILVAQTRNCNFSGLEDAQLVKKSVSAEEYLDKLNQSMPGGPSKLPAYPGEVFRKEQAQKMPQPSVNGVSVLCDEATSMRGDIYYQNIDRGFFKLELMNAKYEIMQQVPPLTITVSEGVVEFTLKLDDKLPAGASFRTAYLKITYLKKEDSRDGRSTWFGLYKKWKAPEQNQAALRLRLTPVLSAAQITATNLPVPGKTAVSESPGTPNSTIQRTTTNNSNTPGGVNMNDHISLFSNIRSDVAFRNPGAISPIQTGYLFKDKNPASDVYYYAPAAYNLRWDADSGFDFGLLYGSASSPNQEGKVDMHAGLSTGITNEEQQFLQRLLQAQVGPDKTPELRPLLPENPLVTLQGEGFVLDKVTAIAASSIYDPVKANWQTDVPGSNDIIAALKNDIGINGTVTYRQTDFSFSAPANARLGHPANFGAITPDWSEWRSKGWKNKLPYPVQFQYLHVLLLNGKVPCIYSWKIVGADIPPGGQAQFDAIAFPAWLETDNRVLKVWFEYQIPPCTPCAEEVLDALTGGTASSREKWIQVQSLGILGKYKARLLKVTLRSTMADPRGKSAREVTATINQDYQDVSVGPLYAWMDKDVRYEVRITLVTDDKSVESAWVPKRNEQQFIDVEFMKTAFRNSLKHPSE